LPGPRASASAEAMGPEVLHEPPPTALARGRLSVSAEVVVLVAVAAVLALVSYVTLVLRRRRRNRSDAFGPASSKRASLRPPKPGR
jgi:hypothetical protein